MALFYWKVNVTHIEEKCRVIYFSVYWQLSLSCTASFLSSLQLSFPTHLFLFFLFFSNFVLDAYFLVAPQNACRILCKCLRSVIPSDGFLFTEYFSMKKRAQRGRLGRNQYWICHCLCKLWICCWSLWDDRKRTNIFFFICYFITGLKLTIISVFFCFS